MLRSNKKHQINCFQLLCTSEYTGKTELHLRYNEIYFRYESTLMMMGVYGKNTIYEKIFLKIDHETSILRLKPSENFQNKPKNKFSDDKGEHLRQINKFDILTFQKYLEARINIQSSAI